MRNYRVLLLSVLMSLAVVSVLMLASCGSDQAPEESGKAQPADQAATESDNSKDQQPENAQDSEAAVGQQDQAAQEEKAGDNDKEEGTEVDTDIITINTQSSIRISGSKTIYLDPYKRSKAAHDADIILITHAHYDHYDEPSLRNEANAKTVLVCPASMLADVTALDVRGLGGDKADNIFGMKAGEKAEVADGVTVEAVPAYNLNKNFHPKANGWLGYIITMDGVRYYAAGDTDALPELEDVECDIAFFPVGGTYTATATEAASLINKIHPEIAVPIHYGTIVGRAADADTFKEALDEDIKVVKKVEDAR